MVHTPILNNVKCLCLWLKHILSYPNMKRFKDKLVRTEPRTCTLNTTTSDLNCRQCLVALTLPLTPTAQLLQLLLTTCTPVICAIDGNIHCIRKQHVHKNDQIPTKLSRDGHKLSQIYRIEGKFYHRKWKTRHLEAEQAWSVFPLCPTLLPYKFSARSLEFLNSLGPNVYVDANPTLYLWYSSIFNPLRPGR